MTRRSSRLIHAKTAARCRLSFDAGAHARIAVKIIDDRGIECLKVMEV